MKKTQTSSTAMGTAAMRAIESERPANMRICYDPYARCLTNKWFYVLIKMFEGFGEWYTHGALTFIACRYRFITDYLQDCVNSGITQIILLGAGLDSRAYQKTLFHSKLHVFEVDHPATQKNKIKQVKKLFGKLPSNITYVPIDFRAENLDKLLDYNFDKSQKTLFIWEGVTLYLDLQAVESTLTWIKTHACLNSVIIFDYQSLSSAILEQSKRNYLYSIISRLSRENRAFGIEKGKIKEFLTKKGFKNIINTNANQLEHLYCTKSNSHRTVAQNYAIVHAEVR